MTISIAKTIKEEHLRWMLPIINKEAKEITKGHQGQIWAESDGPGKGSKFYVKLKRNMAS